MGADRPPAPSRGTRSVCAFSCRLCPECVEADGRPDGSQLGGSSAPRPACLGPVICPWRWGPAAAPGVRAGVRFGAAAPRFECRVFAPRTACNVDVHVKKKKNKTQKSIVCVHHGCVLGHVRARSALRQGSGARAGKTGLRPGASLGAERVPQCRSQTDRQVRTEGLGTHSLVSWRGPCGVARPRIARPSACPVAEGGGCEARKAWSAFAGQSQSQNWDPAWRASRFPERPAPARRWQRAPPAASASTPPHRSP